MSKYKCLSVCLIFCLIFSGFFAPAEAALPESQAAQRTVQDSVPLTLQDKLFFVEDIPEIVGTETAAAELILNVALAIQHGLTIPKHHARLFIIDIQHDRRDLRMQLQKRFDKIIFRR